MVWALRRNLSEAPVPLALSTAVTAMPTCETDLVSRDGTHTLFRVVDMAVCSVRSECIPKGQKPCLYRFPDASYTLLQKIADPQPHEEAKAVPHHALFRVSSGVTGLKSDDVEDAQHQATRTELRLDATRSIFVSPSGSDAGDGSAQHPLRSLRAAQTAARSAAAAGAQARVLLTAGVHRLESQPALLLEAADSGRPGSSTVYSGQPGAAALVSGGRQLSQWERAGSPWPGAPASAPIWRADVSALRNTTAWPFHTLRVGTSHGRWLAGRAPAVSGRGRSWGIGAATLSVSTRATKRSSRRPLARGGSRTPSQRRLACSHRTSHLAGPQASTALT